MKTYSMTVSRLIKISFDEARFTKQVMSEFNECISDFGTEKEAFDRHAEHIAYLVANGEDTHPGSYWEGYGVLREAGINISADRNIDIEFTDRAL